MSRGDSERGRGVPWPYLITPQTDDEALNGRATLLSAGDLRTLIDVVKEAAPERTDLVEKFEELLGGGAD